MLSSYRSPYAFRLGEHSQKYEGLREKHGELLYNMKIRDSLDVLKMQLAFRRTICGRSITEYALEVIESTIQDEKNYDSLISKCINCKFIASSLLFSEGCPNCGLKHDLTTEISKAEILKGE
jgi:hypothetical protein